MSTNDKQSNDSSLSKVTPDQKRTFAFIGVALACVVITGIVEWASHPDAIEEYGQIGKEFYPEFTDPTGATSLEVYALESGSAKLNKFIVKQLANGRWVIPSHHDYPADAQEKLAKTAASLIGIKRGAMVTRWPNDHARYGVVNPQQDTLMVKNVEGVGSRITLRGKDNAVLADYIIGKKTDDQSGQYYVRQPEEDEVYITKLEIDLSTKFADWINTDLLELDGMDVRQVTINDYAFDDLQGTVTTADVTVLDRKTSSDPWTLEGLAETEEVNADAMRETVNTMADLKIIGVRPKRKGLTPDLKIDRTALRQQSDLTALQQELLTRGFALQPGKDGDPNSLRLLAREGELYAAAQNGLHYFLHFGRAFAGTEEELEIGLPAAKEAQEGEAKADEQEKSDKAKKEDDKKAADENATSDDDADPEKSETTKGNPGRYVFVRVEFDKQYLGEEPVKPVEPQEPPELKAAEENAEQPKEENAEAAKTDAAAENEGDQPANADGTEEQTDPTAQLREEYEAAKRQYDSDLREYERKLEDYNKKVDEGKKKAEELNRRFADWYYVIAGDSFDKLRLTRADLVKPKEAPETPEGTEIPAGSGPPAVTVPPVTDPAMEQPPATSGSSLDTPEPVAEPVAPVQEEPAKTEPAKTEPAKTEPAKTEPAKTEPAKEEPAKEEPAKEEPAKEEPAKTTTESGPGSSSNP